MERCWGSSILFFLVLIGGGGGGWIAGVRIGGPILCAATAIVRCDHFVLGCCHFFCLVGVPARGGSNWLLVIRVASGRVAEQSWSPDFHNWLSL